MSILDDLLQEIKNKTGGKKNIIVAWLGNNGSGPLTGQPLADFEDLAEDCQRAIDDAQVIFAQNSIVGNANGGFPTDTDLLAYADDADYLAGRAVTAGSAQMQSAANYIATLEQNVLPPYLAAAGA